jgi:radical SAM protein with 4Fe4S-binding SPASM domain
VRPANRGRAKRGEVSTPTYLVWEITLACDLGCKHCGSRAGKARDSELSTEQCLELVRQFAETGIREITLIGGEAYLRDDWHIIAAAISDAGMRCGITTGARNLDQDRVDKAVAAGVHTIGISIDGLQETHDMLRGPGSYEALLGAAERIAKTPIRLTTNSQINRLSMPELPALADRIVAMGSKAWQIAVTVPLGRAADRPELVLQPYDLLELFPLLVWVKRNHLDPAGVRLFPANNVGYFGPYSAELRSGSHFGGCGAGRTTLGVEADGSLKACPSLPSADYTVGNLGASTLESLSGEDSKVKALGKRTVDDLWGFCATCYYAEECLAGCTWTSHAILGRPGNNPYCVHRQLELAKEGIREKIEKVAAAPGKPFDYGRFELVHEPLELGEGSEELLGMSVEALVALTRDDLTAHSKSQIRKRLRIL